MATVEEGEVAVDGGALFTRRWSPAGAPRGEIALVHGFGEHSGRYHGVGEDLARAGYGVSSFDLRGHGRSPGRRGDTRFAPTFRDLDALLERARVAAAGAPVFFYGHSLGGLLVLAHLLERRPALAGAVVSAPALHTALRAQRVKVALSMVLGRVVPSVVIPAGLSDEGLTRDAAALAAYRADPLVHNRASLGFARDALLAMDRVLAEAAAIDVPLLVIHGTADPVNFPSGSQALAAALGDRCALRLHPDVLHEPHHDPEREAILAEVVRWLDERGAASAPGASPSSTTGG